MRHRSALLLAMALALPAASRAQAPCERTAATLALSDLITHSIAAPLTMPSVVVCANGHAYRLPALTMGAVAQSRPMRVDLGRGASFTFSAAFDSDPFSSFTFGSILPGGFGPLSFDAFFTTPVVPGAYTTATSSGTLDITTTGSQTTGIVTAGTYPFYISGLGDMTNLGVDTGTGACSVSTPPTPNSGSCDPAGASSTFAAISPSFLTAHLSYTHNTIGAGSSTVSWTGSVVLDVAPPPTTVPEPASVTLVLGGLLLLGGVGFGRRAS
jgi:hypothetical protein